MELLGDMERLTLTIFSNFLIYSRISLNLYMLTVYWDHSLNLGFYFSFSFSGVIVVGAISYYCLKGRKVMLYLVIGCIVLVIDCGYLGFMAFGPETWITNKYTIIVILVQAYLI
jgi:hypothetical protein